MFKLYGELAEAINTVETTWQSPISEPSSRGEQQTDDETARKSASSAQLESTVDLSAVEDAITTIYNSLPDSMAFSSDK